MAKLLLIEDDIAFAEGLIPVLKRSGHVVEHALNGKEGLDLVQHLHYDLVIIDWQLPDLSGPEICKQLLAKKYASPLLMLTSRGSTSDKIVGLDSGALDYVVKITDAEELIARVRSLLRRDSVPSTKAKAIQVGPLTLNKDSHEVMVNGAELKLTKTEYTLLEFFALHPGQCFSAEAILQRLWRGKREVSIHVVRVYINRIREKLAVLGLEDLLTTSERLYLMNVPHEVGISPETEKN